MIVDVIISTICVQTVKVNMVKVYSEVRKCMCTANVLRGYLRNADVLGGTCHIFSQFSKLWSRLEL